MLFDTKREACEAWVREMNAFPQAMIQKLMESDCDDWSEVTAPSVGDRVFVFDKECEGEIANVLPKVGTYLVNLDDDDGTAFECGEEDFDILRDGVLPMWGTMWQFGDQCDDWWLEEMDGIRIMSECGFRIYESEEFGYFFGIDGAGYSFYEAHWIPLYERRGLHWHKEEKTAS